MVGISRFSGGNVLSQSAEKNRTGILRSFTDPGIEKFCITGIGHDFLSNFFVSQRRKKTVDESLSVSFNLGNR